jgi:hypothetical protein
MNQLAAMMKMQGLQQEEQVNALALREAQAKEKDRQALAGAISGVNPQDPSTWGGLIAGGAPGIKAMSDLATMHKETQSAAAARFKDLSEHLRTNVAPTIKTPAQALRFISLLHEHPDLKPFYDRLGSKEEALSDAETIMQSPGGLETLVNGLTGLTPDKLSEMTDRSERNRRENANLALSQQKFEWEKNNPGFEIQDTPQGLVAVNKRTGAAQAVMLGGKAVESTESPAFKAQVRTAEKRGELTAQAESDQATRARGAANVLTSLGYNLADPSTDDDVVTLIKKSTGGLLEASVSQIPRAIGASTPGRLAIAGLKTIANNTAMDLLGGKIGAGISNADRDFIIAGLGEIADPLIPVDERVTAWREVTARLARIANSSKVSPATDGAALAGGQGKPPLSQFNRQESR